MSREIYCVLGMHRSGTSAIAKALHCGGVPMGFELLGANVGNQFGHYEDVEILNLHRKFLDRFYGRRIPNDCDSNIFFEELLEFNFSNQDFKDANLLIERRLDQDKWGWKDPRTSLFLDFWLKILPSLKIIILFRHPFEVFDSLLRRGSSEVLMGIDFIIDNWVYYYSSIMNALSGRENKCIVVSSSDVFNRDRKFVEKLSNFAYLDAGGIVDSIQSGSKKESLYDGGLTDTFRDLRPDASFLFDVLTQQSESTVARFDANTRSLCNGDSLRKEFKLGFGYDPSVRAYNRFIRPGKESWVRRIKSRVLG